jgi:hypothetical protein
MPDALTLSALLCLVIDGIAVTDRMQVEVSKYTEGLSEKRMRPNEMPVSLIHYDGESTIHPSAFSPLLCYALSLSCQSGKLSLLPLIMHVSVL